MGRKLKGSELKALDHYLRMKDYLFQASEYLTPQEVKFMRAQQIVLFRISQREGERLFNTAKRL